MAESLPGPSVERKERLMVAQDLHLVGPLQRILPLVQKAISLPIASSALLFNILMVV